MGSSCRRALLIDREPRISAVERPDLALLIDREHARVRRRIDVEPNNSAQLRNELRVYRPGSQVVSVEKLTDLTRPAGGPRANQLFLKNWPYFCVNHSERGKPMVGEGCATLRPQNAKGV